MARPKTNLTTGEIKAEQIKLGAERKAHTKGIAATEATIKAAKSVMTKAVAEADKMHKAAVTSATKAFEAVSKAQTRDGDVLRKAADKIDARLEQLKTLTPAPLVTVPTSTKVRGARVPKTNGATAPATVQ